MAHHTLKSVGFTMNHLGALKKYFGLLTPLSCNHNSYKSLVSLNSSGTPYCAHTKNIREIRLESSANCINGHVRHLFQNSEQKPDVISFSVPPKASFLSYQFTQFRKARLLMISPGIEKGFKREYSFSSSDESKKSNEVKERLPSLMKFKCENPVPNPLVMLKSLFTAIFIVKPQLDKNFSLSVFQKGATQAFLAVSNKLARVDLEGLKGLLTDKALEEIKPNISLYKPEQLALLNIEESNISHFFLENIEIIVKSDTRKLLEIPVIFHVFKPLPATEHDLTVALRQFKILIAHYKFIREYVNGEGGEWFCSQLNYQHMEQMMKPRFGKIF